MAGIALGHAPEDLNNEFNPIKPRLPETDHGEVALEPLTMAIGAAVAGAATLWHQPEVIRGFEAVLEPLTGSKFPKEPAGRIQNDKQNRGKRLLKQFGIGNYNSDNYDREHFRKTGKARPMSEEQIRCHLDAYCTN